MLSKRVAFKGTHLGIDGIIICTSQRITFISKSAKREVLKRWYCNHIGNINVDVKEDVAVMEFYEFGRRVVFEHLSEKGVNKIKSFIEQERSER